MPLLLLSGMAATVLAVSPAELSALHDLYDAAGGLNWTDSTGWNTTTDPCTGSWVHIDCDGYNAHILGLSLGNNFLVGSLPDSLSALFALEYM